MIAEAGQAVKTRAQGGSFLLEEIDPQDVFTIEDLSAEQQQIAEMAAAFAEERVLSQSSAFEAKQYSINRQLLGEAGALGLLGAEVPEEFGGLDLDKVTSTLVTEKVSNQGSFAVTYGAHTGIGTLPLVWYGTQAQKEKYLPKLSAGDWIAAYALSEASAGSDAMSIRASAKLSPDGKHYILNGEKMWISNAGFADLYTVFAKIDGEHFSAFLVERTFPGFSVGPEEHKLGIRGSSTCPLVLNDCLVPIENLLGAPGKGHLIAFNVLNVGRYKLAAAVTGTAKTSFRDGVRYAKQRKAFGKSIGSFGLVQQKIAACAADLYVIESLLYRVVGAMDDALRELSPLSADYVQQSQVRIEEFAVECSILKVWASEMVCRVVDEMVQIHGGYGYVTDFPAERNFRDARINKIFEGTNEINRLIISSWLQKRGAQGKIPLFPAIQRALQEAMQPPSGADRATPKTLISRLKQLGLCCAGIAANRFGEGLKDEQEILAALSDILIEVLALESAQLRAQKTGTGAEMAEYYSARALSIIRDSARRIVSRCAPAGMLQAQLKLIDRLVAHAPGDMISVGQEIAKKMIDAGRYAV